MKAEFTNFRFHETHSKLYFRRYHIVGETRGGREQREQKRPWGPGMGTTSEDVVSVPTKAR